WRWEDSRERIALKERDFERLWRNNTHGLRVLDFPEAAKKELLKYRPPKAPVVDPSFREPRCPACLELVDRSSFRKGIPVCPKCHTFLPVSLVGFSHYLIEGCRAQLRSGEETVNGRVVKADYSGPSFHFRTDNGREMDVTGEI